MSADKFTATGFRSEAHRNTVRQGIAHLRKLAFGPSLTMNPNLPDEALAEIETAENWLRKVGAI